MKHLEDLFLELAAKVKTNRVLAAHYQLISDSMRRMYPNVDVMGIAIKALGGDVAKMTERRAQTAVREQKEAVYAETVTDTQGCATCGGAFTQPIEKAVESILPDTTEQTGDSDIDLIEGFIRANDTDGFFKFLKTKGAKVANKDAKNLDKLIAAYENYKRG
jgi:hypothetical protein